MTKAVEKLQVSFATHSISRKGGGVATAVEGLSRSLDRAGIRIRAYAIADEFTSRDESNWSEGVSIELVSSPLKHWSSLAEVTRGARASTCDVFHLHGLWSAMSVATAVSRIRTDAAPLVISPHGMLEPWALNQSRNKKRLALSTFEGINFRNAACIHALTKAEALDLRNLGFRTPIAVIPNGIDTSVTVRRAFVENRGSDPRTLLFLGRIHPKKGLLPFTKQFLKFAKSRPEGGRWLFKIAGPSELNHEVELRKAVRELGGEDVVRFVGPVYGKEKERLLASVDAFVLPSFSEGLPMSVLEAWAHSLPVLMTRQCNLSESFALGAAMELDWETDSIRRFLEMSSIALKTAGANGRKLIDERYCWHQVANSFVSLYRWLRYGGAPPPFMNFRDA